MRRRTSVKHDPRLNGHDTLDDMFSVELTNMEKADQFMSVFIGDFHAFGRYRKYIESSVEGVDVLLAKVKTHYISCVENQGWTQEKYVTCLDRVFTSNSALNQANLTRLGVAYDKGLIK